MTKNSRNRSVLAWLLTFALLLSLVPAQAFAQDTDTRIKIPSADFWGVEMPALNSQKTEADFQKLLKTIGRDPYSVAFIGLETESGDPINLPYTFSQPGQTYKAKYKVSAKSGFVFNEHPTCSATTITGKTINSPEQLTATNTADSSSFTMHLPLTVVANEPLLTAPPTNLRIDASGDRVKVKFEAPKSEKAYTAKIYLLNNEEPSPIGAEAQESMTKAIDANKDTQIVEWDITSALTSVGQWRARLVYKPESSNDYLYGSKQDSDPYEVTGYTVKITGGGISGASPDGKYAKGETITIGADDAPEGQVFDKWEVVSGGITIKHPEQRQTTFTMPANDVEIKATYRAKTYPVTVEGGTLVGDATHTDNNYAENETVTIKANAPEAGKVFDKWIVVSGNVTLANPSKVQTTFTMPAGNVEIKATYKAKTYPVTVDGGKLVGDSVPSDMKYAQGETVKIVAGQEPSGMVFDKWEVLTNNVTLTDVTQAQNSFTMPAGEVKIKATYKAKPAPAPTKYLVTVEGGELVGDSAHADKKYAQGETVTIKANATETGKVFDKWEIVAGSTSVTFANANEAQTTFIMPSGEVKVKATYKAAPAPAPTKYLVTVQEGRLAGSAPSDMMYAQGKKVSIVANPEPSGKVFDKWVVVSGTGVSFADEKQASTSFTMPANAVTVKATYKAKPAPAPTKYLVTVEGGELVGDSAHADKKYAQGETVTIKANATETGKVFDKWEIVAGSTSVTFANANEAQTTFIMPSGEVKVKATYKAKPTPAPTKYLVTVENGMLAGTVPSDKKYAKGEMVKIVANPPETGKVFDKWVVVGSTGVTFANANEGSTSFTMPANAVTVKATYRNVASSGSGSGSGSFSSYHPNRTNQAPKKPETPQTKPTTDQPKVTEDAKASVKNFTDIDKHWANNAIAYCVEHHIMRGTSEKTFAPNMPVTRGMFVTILGNLSGVEKANYTASKFSDSKGKYYSPYVNWANESGITQGITSSKFMPNMAISREQLAVMIVKYAKQANLALGSKMPQKAFSDAHDISPWAKDAVSTLQMSGLMSGQNANHFNPKAKATRAEVCLIMQKLAMLSDKK